METNKLDKEFIDTLSKRKMFYFLVVFLIMLSGMFLFNQISYMNEQNIKNKSNLIKKDVKNVSIVMN